MTQTTLSRRSVAESIRQAMGLQKEEFAKRLKEAREHAGLSQADAATRIGVSLRSYARWESTHHKDGSMPYGSRLDPIAEALGVTREYLQGPPPAPLGLSGPGIEDNNRLLRIIHAKLDLLLAASGVSLDGMPDDDTALLAALEKRKAETAKPRRRRKTS